MTAAIDIFRASFIDNYHLSGDFLLSLLVSVILFFIGLIYFRKTEYYFADIA
jgi:ABC-type polysaccharide/polyol phosphate export permease